MVDDSDLPGATGIAAQHAPYPDTPKKVAPTDGSDKFNTLRDPLVPVACWLLNDPAFAFDSSFVSSNFRPELVGNEDTSGLMELIQSNAGCPASLFGHCDPMGSDALNKTLGDRRVTAIYALLTRQVPLWEKLYSAPAVGDTWDTQAIQAMLVTGGIQREHASVLGLGVRSPADIYEKVTSFFKEPSQGDFDNVHLAPSMQFSDPSAGVNLSHIAMAPFCIHDCFHTHFRWGSLGGQSATYPDAVLGFVGRVPYSKIANPLVPADQTVSITMTSSSAFEYHAVQSGSIQPGTWSVFNHHGSAYAIEVTGTKKVATARFTVATVAIQQLEPFTRPNGAIVPVFDRDIVSVNPTQSWAAFYQRLQFTGTAAPDVWMPRVVFLDVKRCRTT